MGGQSCLALLAAALAVAAVGAQPASGQCRLCSTPSSGLEPAAENQAIALNIETSLDFDRLILAGNGQGIAVIRPDGSAATQGALEPASARAMVGTASVRGAPGRAIRVELPRRIELRSDRGEIILDDIVSDLPAAPRLDSGGSLTFRFGGRVTVSPDSEGDYRGQVPITVEYQ